MEMPTFVFPIANPVVEKARSILDSEFLKSWNASEIRRIIKTAEDSGILPESAARRLQTYVDDEAEGRAAWQQVIRPGRYALFIAMAQDAPNNQLTIPLLIKHQWKRDELHTLILEPHRVTGRFDHLSILLNDHFSQPLGFIHPDGSLDPLDGDNYGGHGVTTWLQEAMDVCVQNNGVYPMTAEAAVEGQDDESDDEEGYDPGDEGEDDGEFDPDDDFEESD